jgi:serine/threonine-protein kinase
MGRVYEAEHIDIGKRVALKILHPAYSQTPDLVERLRREARAASKIAHPNVVDVTDSGTTPEGAFFFVMEFLEGIELGELIYREKRLDIRRTLIIGTQICRALQAAHEVNVIHRDLKPENVLILRRDGQRDYVKVLDFGIAKSGNEDLKESQGGQRRLTHPGMTMGTPEYMAPGAGVGEAGRSALGRLRRRRSALRDAVRESALRGGEFHGDPSQEGEQHAGADGERSQRRAGAARRR